MTAPDSSSGQGAHEGRRGYRVTVLVGVNESDPAQLEYFDAVVADVHDSVARHGWLAGMAVTVERSIDGDRITADPTGPEPTAGPAGGDVAELEFLRGVARELWAGLEAAAIGAPPGDAWTAFVPSDLARQVADWRAGELPAPGAGGSRLP